MLVNQGLQRTPAPVRAFYVPLDQPSHAGYELFQPRWIADETVFLACDVLPAVGDEFFLRLVREEHVLLSVRARVTELRYGEIPGVLVELLSLSAHERGRLVSLSDEVAVL